MYNLEILRSKSLKELLTIARDLGLRPSKKSDENSIIFSILDFQASNIREAKEYFSSKENPTDEKKKARSKSSKQNKENSSSEDSIASPPKRTRKGSNSSNSVLPENTQNPNEENKTKEHEKITKPNTRLAKPKPSSTKQSTEDSLAEENRVENQESVPKKRRRRVEKNTKTESLTENSPEESVISEKESKDSQEIEIPSISPENNEILDDKQHKNKRKEVVKKQNDNANTNEKNPEAEPKKEFNFDGLVTIEGVLEILQENYGFLRSPDFSYISSPDDVYVSTSQIRNYGLKTGDTVKGIVRLPRDGEKYFSLLKPLEVNGRDLDYIKDRVPFEHLTPLFPEEKFNLAGKGSTTSTRIVDLFAPIGKGQRAMIVAQPKTGKTMLLKEIANAISTNHPEAYMMVLLIDERPEEVTDMERSVNAEVIASTFDESADKHVKVANLVLAKAQRLVECGHDVVILLDSITRLARAYNTVTPASGKILSGGVDANALHKPKRFFGAARNIENGGSLTIIATALIDTGSKMDEVIFEEFKGTGNMELLLDRRIANKRVYPAIDLVSSSTRKDDLLHDELTSKRMWILRKYLSDMNPIEAMEWMEKNINTTIDNEEFLMSMNK